MEIGFKISNSFITRTTTSWFGSYFEVLTARQNDKNDYTAKPLVSNSYIKRKTAVFVKTCVRHVSTAASKDDARCSMFRLI